MILTPDRMISNFYIRGLLIRSFDNFCQLLVERESELEGKDKEQQTRINHVYQNKVIDTMLKALMEFSKN